MWTIAVRQVRFPILCMAGILVAAPAAPAPLYVEWVAGRLSISAEQVPLAQLLHEVAHQTGMEIDDRAGLQEPCLSALGSSPSPRRSIGSR